MAAFTLIRYNKMSKNNTPIAVGESYEAVHQHFVNYAQQKSITPIEIKHNQQREVGTSKSGVYQFFIEHQPELVIVK